MQSMALLMQLAEWTGFLAAQLYNAGTAVVAHVPAWLPGVNMQRETVWLRRLLLLESIGPVPGLTAAMVRCLMLPGSISHFVSASGVVSVGEEQTLQDYAHMRLNRAFFDCSALFVMLHSHTMRLGLNISLLPHTDVLFSCTPLSVGQTLLLQRKLLSLLLMHAGSLRQSTVEPAAGCHLSAGLSAGKR